jgi:hydrogenase maturation protease
MSMHSRDIVVLGVGNTLWADEGIGVMLARAVNDDFDPEQVEVVDGGTQGLYLLPIVQNARRLLMFDAVSLGLTPGEIVVLRDEEIASTFSKLPVSLHQTSLNDLLASAYMLDWQPEEVVLIGIQVEDTESWGGPITDAVQASMPRAIEMGRAVVTGWCQTTVSV